MRNQGCTVSPRTPTRRTQPRLMSVAALLGLLCSAVTQPRVAHAQQVQQPTGPGNVLVHSKFGGQIFGFDIDQNGTEGVLSEAKTLSNGNNLVAVETFDQQTGKILKVVTKQNNTQDDWVTMGVVGNGAGLVLHEHEVSFLHIKRTFHVLDPLDFNKFTGVWTPPIDSGHLIRGVSRNQGNATNAFFAYDNSGSFIPFVFASNVAANTFGPVAKITDPNFSFGVPPVIAMNTTTNQAVLAQDFGSPTSVPEIGLVDLTKGKFSKFNGVGLGFVNGIAVDSADGIACTATEIDFSVEFYDLKKHTGFSEILPGATNQTQSGSDIEFDPVHKLFLVAQEVSSTGSGSSIQVYDIRGNLVESLNGFNFSNRFNVIGTHIALKPSNRSGFVDGPDSGVTDIQSFTY
jgi:hypothetical protein